MEISYNFNGDEYVYDTSIIDYVEDTYSLDAIIDIYIEEIYNKSEDIKNVLKDDLDIKSAEELKDYVYYMDDALWMIDELIETLGEEYFADVDLEDYYEDEAYESYLSDISIEDIENEDNERRIQRHWW